ncbi:MAG TPA: DUF3667 domain-containing protein [Bacteroidetes bacterium]|nr:DUF3667 domain-containing protein [Bacteroidota bacterium]
MTVRRFLKEFIGDYFTFDAKFFRSLFPLLFKQGHLTKEYISGRRANDIYPLRLYIFTTFLFFFIQFLCCLHFYCLFFRQWSACDEI